MSQPPAVALAPGAWRIPTTPFDLVNCYLLVGDDGRAALVDAGTRGSWRRLAAGVRHAGVDLSQITHLVLTHAHVDHGGGAAQVVRGTGATVVASDVDAPYVRKGTHPPVDPARSSRLARLVARLSGPSFPAVEVGEEVGDGQRLDVAGGLRALATPGHTPGHVSLLHEPTGVLVVGDALFHWTRRVTWPPRMLCSDAVTTRESAHVLGEAEYDVAAFMHGPEIRHQARERVRGFLLRERALPGGAGT